MDPVTVKNKFQIVIPQRMLARVHIAIGDLLEAGVENGKIVFTPKSLVELHIAEGLEDAHAGRTHGPYATAEEEEAALEVRARGKSASHEAALYRESGQAGSAEFV